MVEVQAIQQISNECFLTFETRHREPPRHGRHRESTVRGSIRPHSSRIAMPFVLSTARSSTSTRPSRSPPCPEVA